MDHYKQVFSEVKAIRRHILNKMREETEQFTLQESKYLREEIILLLQNVEDQTISPPDDPEDLNDPDRVPF